MADREYDAELRMLTRLCDWYGDNARDLPWRRDIQPYHVWISEIMLQQTRVEAVKGYYKRFLDTLPTIETLAHADDEVLLKLWEGLGYYNRVRNLKKAAGIIMERHGGVFPQTYGEIRALPGIGAYTAGAIASICFEQPTPAVDGNVLRVYARAMAYVENIDRQSTKNEVTKRLSAVYPEGKCRIATQSLMELGATVCVPNGSPHCDICPLADMCRSREKELWKKLPLRAEKKARRREELTVLVLSCDGKTAIRKRPQKGLLSGLWEFPHIEGRVSAREAADVAAAWGVSPDTIRMQTNHTHIFSHVEWDMTAYYIDCFAQNSGFVWADTEELKNSYALPSAFYPFFAVLSGEDKENRKK